MKNKESSPNKILKISVFINFLFVMFKPMRKVILSIFILSFFACSSFAKDLTVSYIDIGQGDSELIELPDGKNILIDAGDREGANNLLAYLKNRKIKKLDLIIITHPHLDHYGGLIKVLKEMKDLEITQVFDSGAKTTSSTYAQLLEQFLAKKVKFKIPRKGEEITYNKDLNLKLLAPQEPLLKNTKSDINNSSIVSKLTYKDISFLFTGDTEEESQNQILSSFSSTDLKSSILKVAHHGSRYTTSNEFLDSVKPEIAVISAGKGNTYGHPHQEALDRLNDKKIPIYRTDMSGTIIITTDGKKYTIKTEKTTTSVLPKTTAKTNEKVSNKNPKENTESNKNKKVNINTATSQEIEKLPGVGIKTAEKIIKGRPYKSISDLEKVDGIGKKRLEKFIDLVVVE